MKYFTLLLPLALAACGTLPEPFYGNPGPEGAKLAAPTAPVLMIPSPTGALLGDESAKIFAQDLADALQNYDVPSIAGPAQTYGWTLKITAQLTGGQVVPSYDVVGPDGKVVTAWAGAYLNETRSRVERFFSAVLTE